MSKQNGTHLLASSAGGLGATIVLLAVARAVVMVGHARLLTAGENDDTVRS